MCPYEPGSCVVWRLAAPGRDSHSKLVSGEGQTKNGSKDLMEDCGRRNSDPARRKPGVHFWSQAQKEDPQVSAWWPGMPRSPAGHSPEEATWLSSPSPLLRPVGSPLTGRTAGVGCTARQVAVKAEGLDGPDPGSRGWLWGCGTSPLWGERSRSL